MELMGMATGSAFYDTGYYNIAAKRPEEDIGKGATAPFINPLTGEKYPLSFVRLAMLKRDGLLPADVAAYTPDLPPGQANPTPDRVAVDGAIKVPALRNVELNGPYFSNGIAATLMQVVEFYNRGGNFPAENLENLAPVITPLSLSDQEKRELVAFLLSLTDDRVRNEAAPFDHPEIFIANGERGDANTVLGDCSQLKPSGFQRCDRVLVLPATGTAGRQPAGLKPLRPFLDDAGNPAFHFRGQQ
jgi:cytochrome c peroxidase